MAAHKSNDRGNTRPKMTVRRGDTVVVIAGKDRGKRGKVVTVNAEENRVEVENVNIVKRHLKRQGPALQAGIIEKPAPISRSNLMVVCPHCGKPTRVAHREIPQTPNSRERRIRVCKNCDETIDVENRQA